MSPVLHKQPKSSTGSDAAQHYPLPSFLESIISSSSSPLGKLPQDPIVVGIVSAFGASALTFGSIIAYRRYWRRIKNADSVTMGMVERKIWVKGVVTSVGDGDNMRLFHTPGPFYRYPFKFRSIPTTQKALKNETLSIRIAGVDAPENAHFGNPAQPHAKESLEWLRSTILGKRMSCQLLSKDQYNRIVAVPYISRTFWWDQPLPILMLKEGMAVVYKAGGAEYGPWGLDEMLKIEEQARNAKKGLWAMKKHESPGDFKARMKLKDSAPEEEVKTKRRRAAPAGLWTRFKQLMSKAF